MSGGSDTPSEDFDGLLPAETNRVYLDAHDDTTSVEEEELGCEREELILLLNSQPSVRDTAMFSHLDSLDTDPTARCVQPAQTSPSRDQQLTNSDEELLQALQNSMKHFRSRLQTQEATATKSPTTPAFHWMTCA